MHRSGRPSSAPSRRPLALLGPLGAALPLGVANAQDADRFVERAAEVGLTHEVLSGWDDMGIFPEVVRDWVQTGMAVGDLDGDGRLDMVACGGPLPNQILLQQEDGTWAPGPGTAAIRSGELDRMPALGDYDRDGDLDLYICVFQGSGEGAIDGRGRLYDNGGNATFTNVTPRAGVRGAGRTVHALWYDLDLDGWLDLYTSEFTITPNQTYRNNGDGTFTDVTDAWGIDDPGSAHATALLDSDGNGWVDVFPGNDHWLGNTVSLSQNFPDSVRSGSGPGQFTDVSLGSGADQASAIMGIAIGDVNYDGSLDLYKTDLSTNWLLVNNGWPGSGSPWVQSAGAYGVRDAFVPFPESPLESGWTSGWAAAFVDVDLDRWIDLWVVNGHVAGINPDKSFLPREQANSLYRSGGPDVGFFMTQANDELGLLDGYDDRAGAVGDFDDDGDLDLACMATAGRLRYFENQLLRDGRGFLKVAVDAGTSGASGIGAQVRWVDDLGYPHVRPIGGTGPTAAQNELIAHFGLGLEQAVDVEVALPSGITLSLDAVPTNSDLTVVEPTLFVQSSPKVAASTGPDTLPAQVTLRVNAHDSSGAPLDASAVVAIDLPGAAATGPVVHLADNVFERTFEAPTDPGAYRAQVSIDGWVPAIAPVVHAVGPVDPAATTVMLSTEAVRAGSGDTVSIVVTPRDAQGVGIGPGRTVAIDLSGFAAVGGVVDVGDGRYRRSFRPPVQPTIGLSIVAVDGMTIPGTPRVDAGGAANVQQTEVTILTPYPHHGASPNQIKVLVTPRDAGGRRLGGNADVELSIVNADLTLGSGPSGRAAPAPLPTGPAHTASSSLVTGGGPSVAKPKSFRLHQGLETLPREDGSFLFVIEKLPGAPLDASGNIDVFIEGVLVGSAPFKVL